MTQEVRPFLDARQSQWATHSTIADQLAMRPGSQVQAGDRSLLDTLKAMAQKYGLVYETVSDQGGKAQYLFVHPGLQIFVSIPADIENDHEAAIALEAGYNSALGTAVYPVSSPAP